MLTRPPSLWWPFLWTLLFCMFFVTTARSWIISQPPKFSRFLPIFSGANIMSSLTANSNNRRLIVVIAGPTGVGKSDVAAQLCKSKKGIVVSADSVQAFRGVQIGANKPSQEERKETPHLLVDFVDASETYNAAEWQRDALYCIQSLLQQNLEATTPRQESIANEIVSAKKEKGYDKQDPILPVVVGGTMMYLQWLVHGRPDAVRPSKETVERATEIINQYREEDKWNEAVEFVSSCGEAFATRTQQLSGQDWYRLRRTLEIAYSVEEGGDQERLFTGEREGGLESLGYDVRCFFLCPDDRMNHTEIVDRRCEEMIIRGLLKETADLQVSGELPDMAARAIGYRQTLDYLTRENATDGDEAALDAYLNDFTTATRRYAKKQMQWFRRDSSFAFIPVPISEPKQVRVRQATEAIERLCSLPRNEYEQELESTKEDGTITVSEQTKRTNEEQGKRMKFYQFKRHLIKPGSDVFPEVTKQADECTRRLQSQPVKKQRLV